MAALIISVTVKKIKSLVNTVDNNYNNDYNNIVAVGLEDRAGH